MEQKISRKDNSITDISKCFQIKNQQIEKDKKNHLKKTVVIEVPTEQSSTGQEIKEINIEETKENAKIIPKRKKIVCSCSLIVVFIVFLIMLAFMCFMLSRLYYIFNHPHREIDLTEEKYKNSLHSNDFNSNFGSLNGRGFSAYHNINITEDTPFVEFADEIIFYPNGTIDCIHGHLLTVETPFLQFQEAIIQGKFNKLQNLSFCNHTLKAIRPFNTGDVYVGQKIHIGKEGIMLITEDGETPFESSKCVSASPSKILSDEDDIIYKGNIIGQLEEKLIVLEKKSSLLMRTSGDDINLLSDLQFEDIYFVKFTSTRFEYGIAYKDATNKVTVIIYDDLNVIHSFHIENIEYFSLMTNKSMIYTTEHKTILIPNIEENEETIELYPTSIRKFASTRLFGNKFAIVTEKAGASFPVINNIVDITSKKNTAVITSHDLDSKKFIFWKLEFSNITKIAEIEAEAAKAVFRSNGNILIIYSSDGVYAREIVRVGSHTLVKKDRKLSFENYQSFFINNDPLIIFGNKEDNYEVLDI